MGHQLEPGNGEGWIDIAYGLAEGSSESRRVGFGSGHKADQREPQGLLEKRIVIPPLHHIPSEIGILGMSHHAHNGCPRRIGTAIAYALSNRILIGPILAR